MNTAPFVMTVSKELAHKEPHLTLEFLSEVVAGFQQYSPALKQFCLAYLSPWLPNLSLSLCEATATEHEKVTLWYKCVFTTCTCVLCTGTMHVCVISVGAILYTLPTHSHLQNSSVFPIIFFYTFLSIYYVNR